VAAARERWRAGQKLLDPFRLIFIDETGTSTNMARLRGRARRGARLIGKVPHGHWKITTFVAGLRCDEITAPFVIDKPMNSAIFLTYLEKCLVPILKPGDVVVLDNLTSHKNDEVRRIIEAAGATLLYLPPYSRTSIRSSKPSPSSKRICAKPPSAPSPPSGTASALSSTSSRLTNAEISSGMPGTRNLKPKTL